MSSEATDTRTYLLTFIVLLVLTALTVGVAYVDLGGGNVAVALLLATTKAGFVAWFFMHLRGSPRLITATAIVGIAWLAILIGLTMDDFLTRHWDSPAG